MSFFRPFVRVSTAALLLITRLAYLASSQASTKGEARIRQPAELNHVAVAEQLFSSGRYADAIDLLRDAPQSTWDSDDALLLLARAFAHHGRTANAGSLQRALHPYRLLLPKAAKLPSLRFELGEVLLAIGDFEEAASVYSAAMEQVPTMSAAVRNRLDGNHFFNAGLALRAFQPAQAAVAFRHAAEKLQEMEASLLEAVAWLQAGSTAKAQNVYLRLQKDWTDSPASMHYRFARAMYLYSDADMATTRAIFEKSQQLALEAWECGGGGRKRLISDWTVAGPSLTILFGDLSGQRYGVPAPHLAGAPPETNTTLRLGAYRSHSSLIFRERRIYLSQFTRVTVSGDDGLIVDADNCTVYLDIHGHELDLSKSLPRSGSARADSVRHVPKGFLLVTMFAVTYYGVVVEMLSRLAIAREFLISDPAILLIFPYHPSIAKLTTDIKNYLEKHWHLSPSRFVDYEVTQIDAYGRVHQEAPRMRFTTLWTVDWRPAVGDARRDLQHFPPRKALLAVRDMFAPLCGDADVSSCPDPTTKHLARATVVYVSRERAESRRLGPFMESQLRRALAAVLTPSPVELAVFAGDESLRDTIRLFSQAQVVLGVMGGGLSNLIFARAGTSVLEIALPEPHRYYAHLALALGLEYHMFPLQMSGAHDQFYLMLGDSQVRTVCERVVQLVVAAAQKPTDEGS